MPKERHFNQPNSHNEPLFYKSLKSNIFAVRMHIFFLKMLLTCTNKAVCSRIVCNVNNTSHSQPFNAQQNTTTTRFSSSVRFGFIPQYIQIKDHVKRIHTDHVNLIVLILLVCCLQAQWRSLTTSHLRAMCHGNEPTNCPLVQSRIIYSFCKM